MVLKQFHLVADGYLVQLRSRVIFSPERCLGIFAHGPSLTADFIIVWLERVTARIIDFVQLEPYFRSAPPTFE